jgi:hypothetical protein
MGTWLATVILEAPPMVILRETHRLSNLERKLARIPSAPQEPRPLLEIRFR